MRALLVPTLLALTLTGCATGPSYLTRSVDDWQNRTYETSPMTAALMTDILPIMPITKLLAGIPDYLVLNPVQFWTDVFRGQGTAFTHQNPATERTPWFIGRDTAAARSSTTTTVAPLPSSVRDPAMPLPSGPGQ